VKVFTTTGRRIRPINVFEIPSLFAVSSIEATTRQLTIQYNKTPLLILTVVRERGYDNGYEEKAEKLLNRKKNRDRVYGHTLN
jgi:hypothetical protein